MFRIASLAVSLGLAPIALAQAVYDAGIPGSPASAPSPTTQGWQETITGACQVSDVSPDPDHPVNAWQINDPGAGRVLYRKDFPESSAEYSVEIVMRLIAETVYVHIDAGENIQDNIFEFEMSIVGPNVRIVTTIGETVLCPGAADGAYHRYAFESGYSFDVAQVYYDDQHIGDIGYTNWGLADPGAGLTWGTVDAKPGRARFHQVEMMEALGTNYCGPAEANSSGFPGRIRAAGSRWVSSYDLRMDAVDLPVNQFGYFLISETQGFIQAPGGSQGNLCLGGTIGRYVSSIQNSGSQGAFSLVINLQNLPPPLNGAVKSGETWNFTAWFRDKNPATTSNFTDAVSIKFI